MGLFRFVEKVNPIYEPTIASGLVVSTLRSLCTFSALRFGQVFRLRWPDRY